MTAMATTATTTLRERRVNWRPIVFVGLALVVAYTFLGTPQFMNAMTLGAIYALIALGYTMVYGIIELINFAHGDVFMVGTFLSLIFLTTLGFNAAINDPLL